MLFVNFKKKGFATKRNLAHVKNIYFGKIIAETKNVHKVAQQLYFPLGVLNFPRSIFFFLCQKSSFSYFRQNVQYLQIHIVFHKRYSRKHEKNL